MVKIIKYINKSGLIKLVNFLDRRRNTNNEEMYLVKKIIDDVKKINKCLKKYEKIFQK